MTQQLEAPTRLERLNQVDQQILKLLKDGHLPLEQVVALVDGNRSEILSSISRLIGDGSLGLVILEYPWGIEFDLELKRQGEEQFSSEAHTMHERVDFSLVTS